MGDAGVTSTEAGVNVTEDCVNTENVHYFIHSSFATSVLIILLMSFLEKRKSLCTDCCWGRPGILIPLNMLDDYKHRWSYAFSFGAITNTIIIIFTGFGAQYFGINVPPYLSAVAQLITALEICVIFYPLFACITTRHRCFGSLVGFSYSTTWLSFTMGQVLQCSGSDEGSDWSLVVICLPTILCLFAISFRFLFNLFHICCCCLPIRRLIGKQKEDEEEVKKLQVAVGWQINYTRSLLNPPPALTETKIEEENSDDDSSVSHDRDLKSSSVSNSANTTPTKYKQTTECVELYAVTELISHSSKSNSTAHISLNTNDIQLDGLASDVNDSKSGTIAAAGVDDLTVDEEAGRCYRCRCKRRPRSSTRSNHRCAKCRLSCSKFKSWCSRTWQSVSKKTMKLLRWFQQLIVRNVLEKRPQFKYSSRMICCLLVIMSCTYQLGLAYYFATSSIINLMRNTFNDIMDNTDEPKNSTFIKNVHISLDMLYISWKVITILSVLLFMINILAIMLRYRRDMMKMFRGEKTLFIPESVRHQTSQEIVAHSMLFTGFQIAYMIWGYFLANIVLWIAALLGCFLIVLPIMNEFYDIAIWFLNSCIVPLIVSMSLRAFQTLLSRLLFLQNKHEKDDKNKPLALNNLKAFHITNYFMVMANIETGFFSCLYRILQSLIYGLIFLGRLDRCVLMPGFEANDKGYTSYIGMLYMEHTHNNPVLRTFCQLLVDSASNLKDIPLATPLTDTVKEKTALTMPPLDCAPNPEDRPAISTPPADEEPREKESKNKKIPRLKRKKHSADEDELKLTEIRRPSNRTLARRRWYLAFTLVRNTQLVSDRRKDALNYLHTSSIEGVQLDLLYKRYANLKIAVRDMEQKLFKSDKFRRLVNTACQTLEEFHDDEVEDDMGDLGEGSDFKYDNYDEDENTSPKLQSCLTPEGKPCIHPNDRIEGISTTAGILSEPQRQDENNSVSRDKEDNIYLNSKDDIQKSTEVRDNVESNRNIQGEERSENKSSDFNDTGEEVAISEGISKSNSSEYLASRQSLSTDVSQTVQATPLDNNENCSDLKIEITNTKNKNNDCDVIVHASGSRDRTSAENSVRL